MMICTPTHDGRHLRYSVPSLGYAALTVTSLSPTAGASTRFESASRPGPSSDRRNPQHSTRALPNRHTRSLVSHRSSRWVLRLDRGMGTHLSEAQAYPGSIPGRVMSYLRSVGYETIVPIESALTRSKPPPVTRARGRPNLPRSPRPRTCGPSIAN